MAVLVQKGLLTFPKADRIGNVATKLDFIHLSEFASQLIGNETPS
jgi:hypothetical protein